MLRIYIMLHNTHRFRAREDERAGSETRMLRAEGLSAEIRPTNMFQVVAMEIESYADTK